MAPLGSWPKRPFFQGPDLRARGRSPEARVGLQAAAGSSLTGTGTAGPLPPVGFSEVLCSRGRPRCVLAQPARQGANACWAPGDSPVHTGTPPPTRLPPPHPDSCTSQPSRSLPSALAELGTIYLGQQEGSKQPSHSLLGCGRVQGSAGEEEALEAGLDSGSAWSPRRILVQQDFPSKSL